MWESVMLSHCVWQLVWLPTIGRICIKQRISGEHQKHSLLCELRNQPRIRDVGSSDLRKADQTGSNDSVTCVINERDGSRKITTQRILPTTQQTRSEPTIRRYCVVVAKQFQDHKTIKATGLHAKRTIQNLAKDWDKRIEAGLTSLNGHRPQIAYLPPGAFKKTTDSPLRSKSALHLCK